jgi:hypothetical protein
VYGRVTFVTVALVAVGDAVSRIRFEDLPLAGLAMFAPPL